MLQITEGQMAALETARLHRFTLTVMRQLRATGDPAIAAMPDAELGQRVQAGLQAGQHFRIAEERDLTLLALAHVLLGADLLHRPEMGFITEILGEPAGTPDNRMFRVHRRLREMPGI